MSYNRLLLVLNVFFVVFMTALFLDYFYLLEIKGQDLKTFVYFGVPVALVTILFLNLFLISSKLWKLLSVIPILIGVLLFSFILKQTSLLNFYMISSSSWQTQEIQFVKRNNKSEHIEFQMKNVGARGYRQRRVQVTYFSPFFMITQPISDNYIPNKKWIKVDKMVNEIGIKY